MYDVYIIVVSKLFLLNLINILNHRKLSKRLSRKENDRIKNIFIPVDIFEEV